MRILRYLFLTIVILFPSSVVGEDAGVRFTSSDDVVVDSKTGLMWASSDNGVDIGWEAAFTYCDNYNGGGFSDWRMPTQEELLTIYQLDPSSNKEYSVVDEISLSACCVWASDTKNQGYIKAGSFDFEYGNKDWGHPMARVEARVLPVR